MNSKQLLARLAELEEFRDNFLDGAYPQRSPFGPGELSRTVLKAKSITGSMMDVSDLQAVSANTGNLTVTGGIVLTGAGSAIRSGLTSFTDIVNSGFWMGIDSGTAKFVIGDQSTSTSNRIKWTGSALEVIGAIKAESGYLKSMTVNGTLDMASSGVIKSGKSGYGSGTGFWIEYNGGTPRIDIGSVTRYLRWDGSTLSFTGSLSGADGTFSGSLSAATGTFAGSLSAATGSFSGAVTASSLSLTGSLSFSGGGAINLPGSGSITASGMDINSATLSGITVDGTITVSTSGKIQSGKTTYGSGTGWLLEYNGGTPRMDIGSSTAYMRWDGSALTVKGRFEFGTGDYLENDLLHFDVGVSAATIIEAYNPSYAGRNLVRSWGTSTASGLQLYAWDNNNTNRSASLQLLSDVGGSGSSEFRVLAGTSGVPTGVGIIGTVGSSASAAHLEMVLADTGGSSKFRVWNSSGTDKFTVDSLGRVGFVADATYGIATGYTTLGSLTGRIAVHNASGSLVGYVPVYTSIT